MRAGADPGKSVPVMKELQPEFLVAPVTPDKPIANGKTPICTNGGQYYTAETEDYLSRFTRQDQGESSYAGFAWEGSNQGERWASPYSAPPSWLSEGVSNWNSIHQGSVMKETEPLEWRGMTFKDLLAMNHGLGNPMGHYQTSNGFLSSLDFGYHSTGLVSENQGRMGFSGSNSLTQTPEIQQSGYQTSNGYFSNLDSQFQTTGLVSENQERMGYRVSNPLTQTAEIQRSGYQTSNGFLSRLDPQFHSTGLVSENQERMGFRASNQLTQTAEIQQSGYRTSNGFLFNLDSQFHSTGLVPENQERMGFGGSNPLIQTAESQQKNVLPNGSGPVFAPETPDQCKRLQNNSADNNPNKQHGEENQVSVIEDPGLKMTQSATDSIVIESYDPEKGDKAAIEQKPRRRKHRPKVIREGKPKRGSKPRTPKPPTDANETPKPKRKYVRKSKTNLPSTTPPENVAEALDCKIPDPTVKSCKKSLDLDMEDQIKEKNPTDPNETPKQKRKYVRKNKPKTPASTPPESGAEALGCKIPGPAVKSCKKGLNFDLEDQEDLFPVKEKDVISETTREETGYDVFKNNQTVKGYMSMSERDAHSILHPTEASSGYACSPNYSACASSNESEYIRGLKRPNSCSADVPNTGMENQAVHCTPSQANYMYLGNASFSCTHGMFFPEINKKRKTERMIMSKSSHILSSTSLQNSSREDVLSSKYYYSTPAPHFNISAGANSQAASVSSHRNTQSINWGDIDKLNKRSKAPACAIELNSKEGSAKGRVNGIRKKTVTTVDTSCMEVQPKVSKPKQSRRRYVKKNSAAKFVTSSFNMVYAHSLNLHGDQHFTGNSKGPFLALPWINTSTTMVEDIIEGMKLLSINREGSGVQYQEQNSLIPYKVKRKKKNALVLYHRNGVMIPFEGTQSSKSQLRAKVDIDDETNRVWTLLLENINNQGIDGTDEEKTKWWEEERKVFRGRVDSFIARMRLVQGDRRFSPWKGSVVDSVVGVFLTQNVSDHLSSSAYMSLAARYPVKSTTEVRRDSEEEIVPIVEEPEICIVELDDNSDNLALNEKTVEGHICDMNSRDLHDSDVSEEKVVNSKESQLYGAGSIKELETPSTSLDDRATDDVTSTQHSVISSQNSVESPSVLPTSGKMAENGLSSDNSSEGEDPTNSSNPGSSQCSGSFVELLKMAEKPMLHATHLPIDPEEVVIYDDHSQKAFRTEVDSFSIVLNQCSTVYSADEESRSVNSTRLVENFTAEAHNVTRESATDFQLHKKDSKSNVGLSSLADNVCSSYVLEGEEMIIQSQRQLVNEQQDKINLLTEESMSLQMNINLPTASRDNVATESTCGSNISGEAHNMLKEDAAKKKTGKTPKKPSYDWDNLRKQAQTNGRTRQKTANTMDSIDWEAIKCADVNDIAYVIRERGMNNRLAERIKEFLDRLVSDHGSIDLEWLRDVPPDKAKEYLLSINGLGLKSVECVRLLTLHHLAFPVDTNVGRIAVRLGWVPLQPLPESLQLHLLELYPVLESIQKYLWPRLCKLDQRTLYELHYHMITFGKVFCTKKQPNCNACPLRGECRHFASAFASARLALPGPQDKSIVLPDQSNPTHQDPPQVTINSVPMPLLMAADQTLEPKSEVRNCEPIVEIPASPEPEPVQALECDIEDAYSEDPNEIPTIKLNMEEFTQTLQAYMHSNKELQGDMSKALVALAAEAASIPAPKLKNISRLRTEHHVYELPDNHYLLRGMDKREPDDPCPYLLAIWAPGETANSTEPPVKRCNFQEPGELCSDETCSYCNSQREANSQIARGTLLIPCRTAMRGSFPLNGTYFQVNEVFADHVSSLNPIQVPTSSLWNLPRRTVYFGTSVPTIFKGLTTEYIQHCFWRGYVCVRGFDQKTRAPRPLMPRLHFPAYHKTKGRGKSSEQD